MNLSTLIVLYVFGLLIEIALLFIKPRYLAFLPIIASCIAFLILKEVDIFYLSLLQTGILFVGLLTMYIVDARAWKRKQSGVDKTKIKDL